MERYSRYTDSKSRLFVVLARRARIDINGQQMNLIPTTVELLNVHEEKAIEMSAEQFNNYVASGQLKKFS